MLPDELIKAIDADIDKHHQKAAEMLDVVKTMLSVFVVMLVAYLVPGMCERGLPSMEEVVVKEEAAYEKAVAGFKAKYKEDYVFISRDDFQELAKRGAVDDKTKAAREVAELRGGGFQSLTYIVRVIASLKAEDTKIEFALKILPYVIGAVLAGFLVTYRLHVTSAKELAAKKFDVLGRAMAGQEPEG